MTGFLKVFTGPMFSSKSTGLIEHLRRAKIAKKSVIMFKPSIDNRYSENEVVSHNGEKLEAVVLHGDRGAEIAILAAPYDVVGVDEIQFFNPAVVDALNILADAGKEVVVSGLNADFMGQPFETTALVLHHADRVEKLAAVCRPCGNDAVWTQLIQNGKEITGGDPVHVGGSESYEPRCRGCFVRSSGDLSGGLHRGHEVASA